MIQQLREAFPDVIFHNEAHKYFRISTGQELTSVTTWIRQYQPEFKEDYWLSVKAAERGITKEELKAEWLQIGLQAREQGSLLHSWIENRLQRKIINPTLPEYINRNTFNLLLKQAEQFCQDLDYQ